MADLISNLLDINRLAGAPLIFGAALAVAGYVYKDQMIAKFNDYPYLLPLLDFFAGVGLGFWLLK